MTKPMMEVHLVNSDPGEDAVCLEHAGYRETDECPVCRIATLEAALRLMLETPPWKSKAWDEANDKASAALSPSSSAPADEYRRGVEDAARLVEKWASNPYPGKGDNPTVDALVAASEVGAVILAQRIRALAPPSPSSAAKKEEP